MADENMEAVNENTNATQEQLQDSGREDEVRGGRGKGKAFFHKKVCRFCANKAKID